MFMYLKIYSSDTDNSKSIKHQNLKVYDYIKLVYFF